MIPSLFRYLEEATCQIWNFAHERLMQHRWVEWAMMPRHSGTPRKTTAQYKIVFCGFYNDAPSQECCRRYQASNPSLARALPPRTSPRCWSDKPPARASSSRTSPTVLAGRVPSPPGVLSSRTSPTAWSRQAGPYYNHRHNHGQHSVSDSAKTTA